MQVAQKCVQGVEADLLGTALRQVLAAVSAGQTDARSARRIQGSPLPCGETGSRFSEDSSHFLRSTYTHIDLASFMAASNGHGRQRR